MMTLPLGQDELIQRRFPGVQITKTGLRYVIEKDGDGETFPQRGQPVAITYRGEMLDGTYLDDSFKRGEPYRFPAGKAKVVPGMDEAIMTMSQGEKRTLIIPYWLGYGEKGVKGQIPEMMTLIFEVELVEVM